MARYYEVRGPKSAQRYPSIVQPGFFVGRREHEREGGHPLGSGSTVVATLPYFGRAGKPDSELRFEEFTTRRRSQMRLWSGLDNALRRYVYQGQTWEIEGYRGRAFTQAGERYTFFKTDAELRQLLDEIERRAGAGDSRLEFASR